MSSALDGLPENIVTIDALRINRNIEKRCKCENRTFVVDANNRSVHCGECGARVEPYDALYELATFYERLEEQVRRLLEQRRQILNYKPHLVVIRELEQRYRGKNYLPTCPHCDQAFYLEDLLSTMWVNREWYERRQRVMEGRQHDQHT
jgi:PHP family Zn ribbon phosphoesterase